MTRPASLALRWASSRFGSRQREAYYDYLADILDATQGRKTLRQVLADDATRYGPRTVRGYLSAHWAYQLEEHGDIALAYAGTLPGKEVAFFSLLQGIGGGALTSGLRELAALVRLDMRIAHLLSSTLSMAYFALVLSVATMFAICWFTTPSLLSVFSQVNPLFYGPATKRLLLFSEWLDLCLWPLLITLAGGAGAMKYLLPRWHGGMRNMCDRYLPGFGLYRDTQAISFLVLLAAILKPRIGLIHSLSDALSLLHAHSSPWLQAHLEEMGLRLADAHADASPFQTGLLTAQTYWYLEDLSKALGLDAALQKTRDCLEHNTLRNVAKRASLLRWFMVGSALIFLLGVMLWHYSVIYEMRAALLLSV